MSSNTKLSETIFLAFSQMTQALRAYGSDYASFNDVGVPGFSLIGNQRDYDYDQTRHTQADTFDKVNEEGVIYHAQVLAGWAYNTAQLRELLPRN